MTILTLFFFVIIMAIGGLAIDIGRVYGVHGQMQTYVDDLTLASASQLDAQNNAVSRACDAATGQAQCYWNGTPHGAPKGPIIRTSYSFTTSQMKVLNLVFLSALGSGGGPTPTASDTVLCVYDATSSTWTTKCPSSVDASAKYVAVSSAPLSVTYVVLPIADMFLGSNAMAGNSTLQLQATAGYVQKTCAFTPLMICNPSEPAGNTNVNYPFNVPIGRQVKLTDASGNSNNWSPGNFGFISPWSNAGGPCASAGGGTNKQLDCMLAAVDAQTQCLATNATANVQTGNSTPRYQAINVRFDIYENNALSPTNSNYAPAANVEKGVCVLKNGVCDYSQNSLCPNNANKFSGTSTLTAPTVPLPRDKNASGTECFTVDGSTNYPCGSGPIGVGVRTADLRTYWSKAHPSDPALPPGLQTRWDVYRYEIQASQSGNTRDGIVNLSASGGENGNPTCASAAAPDNPNLDRRELFVAIVNCQAWNVHGNAVNPGILAYLKVFMTEPIGYDANPPTAMSTSTNGTLYAEVRGLLTPNDKSGLVHSLAVLYR
ncbi:MAG: Tad domain-containing protein [Alphaproteobacteria bacterium]|nr:Tad domain-containing protein [Alphaproteobacteria bacterium]